jgi:hypothetical protein
VIFDSGPLLFVSRVGGAGAAVDGVVTVVRARQNSRGLLAADAGYAASGTAEHIGVVLNAVRRRRVVTTTATSRRTMLTRITTGKVVRENCGKRKPAG